MRSRALFFLCAASIASSQFYSGEPDCAKACMSSAITSIPGCTTRDLACQCDNRASISSIAGSCITAQCGSDAEYYNTRALSAFNESCEQWSASSSSEMTSASATSSQATSATYLETTTTTATSVESGSTFVIIVTSTIAAVGVDATDTATPQASLPVSAQAGIGVGVSLVAIITMVIIVLWWRARRSQARTAPADENLAEAPPTSTEPKAELDGTPRPVSELSGSTWGLVSNSPLNGIRGDKSSSGTPNWTEPAELQ